MGAPMDGFSHIQNIFLQAVTEYGVKALAAVVFWIVGRRLISFTRKIIRQALGRQDVDATITRYLDATAYVTLNVMLVIGILGFFGIQTITFAALFAAVGVAIGMAWSGLLANFAAGIFLILLRPIKLGDYVTVAGITGTVKEIGLFATCLDTPDNVQTLVGNNKVFSDTIQNYTANAYRRVDLKAPLAGLANHGATIERLREMIAAVPNVLTEPAVQIEILELNLLGPVLAVRACTHNDHYWQVYFDITRIILDTAGAASVPAAAQAALAKQDAESTPAR